MQNVKWDVESSSDRLSTLPVDVMLTIIGFLAPCDILMLRRVSKSISEVTRERSVWIEALRRLCSQHDIYGPSFSLPEMSLDELEHAATVGGRFSARLRTEFGENNPASPHSIRTLKPPDIAEEFENMRFLPGGRFVVTSQRTTLRLWDLGNHLHPPIHHPIASFEIGDASAIKTLRTRASPSGSDGLVIVSTTGSIFPPASAPHFTPFAPALVLPGDPPGILGATSRRVAVATAAFTTILWDFIDDTWVSWPREPTEFDDTFYLCNENILLVHADEAQAYVTQLPTLLPRSESVSFVPPLIDSLDILAQYPLCRFNHSDTLESCVSGITLVFHGRERSTPEQPMYVDVLSNDCGKVLLTHFALVPPVVHSNTDQTDTGASGASCELAPLGESPLDALYRDSHSLHLEWLDSGTVQSFVVERDTVHMCVSDVAIDGKTSTSVAGVLVTPGLQPNELNVDFCSFSGRVCARVPAAGGEGFEIAVMDYVGPKQFRPGTFSGAL